MVKSTLSQCVRVIWVVRILCERPMYDCVLECECKCLVINESVSLAKVDWPSNKKSDTMIDT